MEEKKPRRNFTPEQKYEILQDIRTFRTVKEGCAKYQLHDSVYDQLSATSASTQTRLSGAQLLKCVFDLDMAACVHCGGPVRLIATIEDPAVIAKILAHLGLPTKAPPRGPAQPCLLFQTA